MADKSWYYAENNERKGPVPEEQVAALVRAGTIGRETLVWSEGMSDWAPAGSALPPHLVEPIAPTEPGLATAPPVGGAQAGTASWYHPTGFQEAVKTCFNRYATFSGRSRRPEYWWFFLFSFAANILLSIVDVTIFGSDIQPLSSLFSLAVLIPSIAVGARRLHDTGRSGWWLLIAFIPLIGWIILIIWLAKRGDEGSNQYGPA